MSTSEGAGSWTRTRPVSVAPTPPRAQSVLGRQVSPRSASPQRQALTQSQGPPQAETQPAGSRVSVSPMRALSPIRDRQFRASVQMEKKETPPPVPPAVIQSADTPAARDWLTSSAFGERVSVAPVVQRLLLKFAERKLPDEAIWEGSAEVVALLLSHKAELMAVSTPEAEQPIITVHFGIPGVKGANYKAYRVNRAQPTLQTVVQVCKRMNIPSPENCSLSTMRNILLSPTETLAAYGLGSLFESWELRLVERPPEQRIASLAGGPADMLRQALITISFSSTVPEFSALKHKHHRIKVDPYAPLWRILAAVMSKNGFKQPERFCFVTTYEKSDNFVLPERECLASLGLGKYFSTLTVKILLRDKCAFPILRVSSKISWTQLEESRITIPLARKVISDLDMEVATLSAELSDTNARLRDAMAASAARLRQDSNAQTSRTEEMDRLQAEVERLKDDYERLLEDDDTVKFENQNLLGEQALLQGQLRKHAALTADAQAAAESASKDAALLREQNQSLQTENQQLYLLNGKLQQQIVAQERLTAEYQERLGAAEKSNGVSQADLEFELNKLHLHYEEEKEKFMAEAKEERLKLQQARDELSRELRALQLERERHVADASASQAQTATARATVEELQRELQALKRVHSEETGELRQKVRELEGRANVAPSAADSKAIVQTDEMRRAMEEKEKEARLKADEAEARAAEARAESAKAEDERMQRTRLQREMSDQTELYKTEKAELQRRIAEAVAGTEELQKKLTEIRAELQSAQEHAHTLEGQLAAAQRKAEETVNVSAATEYEKKIKEELVRSEELQQKLAHTRTKYTERIESLQTQLRKAGEEKITLQGTIAAHEQKIKDLSAMVPQKEGPGYQEDESIDKILLTKLDIKQLVTLINTLARQTNIHLRTFLLHNKGASTPKPKQVERKPRAPAAPKAPKNIVLAKTVDTSGPLSSNDLEAARTRLKVASKDVERGPNPDDLAGIFAKQLASRFRSVAASGDVEDLDDSSPADFDDDW